MYIENYKFRVAVRDLKKVGLNFIHLPEYFNK